MTGAQRACILQYAAENACDTPQSPVGGTGRVVPDTVRCEPHFEAKWLTHLLAHFDCWCRASDVWALDDPYERIVLRQRAHEAVKAARRLGLIVESDVRLGYRVVGHGDLPRYLRLERPKCRETAPADGHKTQRTSRSSSLLAGPTGGHK